MSPRYYYSLCQTGAEKAMRDEILNEFPDLRFAFSRPGFVTFKQKEEGGGDWIESTRSVFARVFGTSVGQAKDKAALEALLDLIPEGAPVHVFDRDLFVPGDEPEGFVEDDGIHEELRGVSHSLDFDVKPAPGQQVYDLIRIDPGHVFLGWHRHSDSYLPLAGNRTGLEVPAHSPSRAWLKLEEALLRFKTGFGPGTEVLEVGCAPGGATTAMLDRGWKVTGIDPKKMDATLDKKSDFRLIRKPAKEVKPEDLRGVNPALIVLDMNLAPLETLDELEHVVRTLRLLHGKRLALTCGLLTIKLNDWRFANHVPLYLKRIRELGFEELTARQLCSNRQEFFVYANGFK
jgi:23S rRNA (cytidine2498-2'-O)-methyltransferase